MSYVRVFRWTCDACQKTEEREPHGLPRGWGYLPGMGPIVHFCSEACEAVLREPKPEERP